MSKDSLAPQSNKVAAIKNMSVPVNKHNIQVFLGMIGYYWRFITDFSKIAQSFFHLLKNEVPFIWPKKLQSCI